MRGIEEIDPQWHQVPGIKEAAAKLMETSIEDLKLVGVRLYYLDVASGRTFRCETLSDGYAPDDDELDRGERRCRVCGCTETHACVDDDTGEPCHWVEEDLCRACIGKERASGLTVEIDGNALCIKAPGFVDLQESDGKYMFVELTETQLREYRKLEEAIR